MMDKKFVLIVGGAGYIGSHVNKLLSKGDYNTVVFDNLVYGHESFVKWGHFEYGDLSDEKRIEEVFQKYNIVAVMHFAAFAYVGESVTDPQKYYVNNVQNTLNLLRVMIKFDCMNIIFSSTCATYGVPQYLPIDENHPLLPINPYGHTKLFVEKILEDYSKAYGINYVALRYFNAAGADPECEIGEMHDPETHLIPLVLDVASGKKSEICVFGNDYDTKDGSPIRDYIHVMDLASAHRDSLVYLLDGNGSDVFNLSNGSGYSVFEIIDTVERVTNKKIAIKISDKRLGDPSTLIGSSKRARELLGWEPEYYKLETIIETAWNWHQKNNN